MNSDFKIISTGGELRAHSYALVGTTACETIKEILCEIRLLSVVRLWIIKKRFDGIK